MLGPFTSLPIVINGAGHGLRADRHVIVTITAVNNVGSTVSEDIEFCEFVMCVCVCVHIGVSIQCPPNQLLS